MSEATFHTNALSDDCEVCLDVHGLHSLSNPKDESGLARVEPLDEGVSLSKFEVTPGIDAVDLKALLKFGADEYERSRAVFCWFVEHGRKYGIRLIVDSSFKQTLGVPKFISSETWDYIVANAIQVKSIEDDLIRRI